MLDLPVMMPLAALKPTTAPADAGTAMSAPATLSATVAVPATTGPATTEGTTTSTSQPSTIEPIAKPTGWEKLQPVFLLGGMAILLYFVMFRGPKKAEKARKLLLSSMKKGDKVMTIGGLVARVVSIDEDDVVLKIDESANVKAVYKKTSIQQILDRDEKTK